MSKTDNEILLDVKAAIAENGLIEKGDKVLVALSGGADSVCLLDLLCRLRGELSFDIAAAHLNHMIRGDEANRDEAYAAELCTQLDIPFYAERSDVPRIAKEKGVSEELAGRETRYDFFARVCRKNGFNKIATAHNKNDRAETVLMRIMRGTGIDGLGSIKYKRDNIIRPILGVERKDIESYCAERNLKFCTDSTNFESEYTRNKVRNELLPMIEKNFNPGIVSTLCQLADNASEDAAFINGYAKRLYQRINSPLPKRKPFVLDIKSLKLVEKSIRNRLILIAAREVMGDGYSPERVHFESVNALLDKETGAAAVLPSGLRVNVKYGWLEFITEAEEQELMKSHSYSYEIDLNDVIKTDVTDIGEIMVARTDLKDSDKATSIDDFNIRMSVTDPHTKLGKNQMMLDFDMLEDKTLCIRNRRIGDKIVLFKDGRRKKLKSYWIDKKVPQSQRGKIPLLCADNEIAAIIGDRVAENYKVKKSTQRGLLISYGSKNENR